MRPEHVPQLFWQPEYEKHFARYYRGPRPDSFRAYCSTALALAVGATSIGDAHRQLGFSTDACTRNSGVERLRQDNYRDFGRTLARATSDWFDRVGQLIDYAARREALADLRQFPRNSASRPLGRVSPPAGCGRS